ncbi:pirin family protein [Advenella sp. WQ 585]|uniref:Pirin family protein n=1 Tax=Advenella mandrilli TaxID=2800330 RepID=A0ABS1EHI9_9BURK|nr:pirin family protein [Advenella mandrilli]MBK1782495.1 pirin family protein [Advenella mandrilli]
MPEIVIETRPHDLGGGFEVGRVLPFRKHRSVGPFVFFDRMGPHELAAPIPPERDVRPHPHIGLSTVTYLFEGEMTHRDSLGYKQLIQPGELNWMTAGSGISHSERFDGMRPAGGRLDGIQAWVALPEEFEEIKPSFVHYNEFELPVMTEEGIWARLIAGSAFELESPVTVHSPLFYLHMEVTAGKRVPLPQDYAERAVYINSGKLQVKGQTYVAGQMLVFAKDSLPVVQALENASLMLLGGEPLGPRHIWWNFVSSRKERIEQAKEDWKAGKIPLPPDDHVEFIPLPETIA